MGNLWETYEKLEGQKSCLTLRASKIRGPWASGTLGLGDPRPQRSSASGTGPRGPRASGTLGLQNPGPQRILGLGEFGLQGIPHGGLGGGVVVMVTRTRTHTQTHTRTPQHTHTHTHTHNSVNSKTVRVSEVSSGPWHTERGIGMEKLWEGYGKRMGEIQGPLSRPQSDHMKHSPLKAPAALLEYFHRT